MRKQNMQSGINKTYANFLFATTFLIFLYIYPQIAHAQLNVIQCADLEPVPVELLKRSQHQDSSINLSIGLREGESASYLHSVSLLVMNDRKPVVNEKYISDTTLTGGKSAIEVLIKYSGYKENSCLPKCQDNTFKTDRQLKSFVGFLGHPLPEEKLTTKQPRINRVESNNPIKIKVAGNSYSLIPTYETTTNLEGWHGSPDNEVARVVLRSKIVAAKPSSLELLKQIKSICRYQWSVMHFNKSGTLILDSQWYDYMQVIFSNSGGKTELIHKISN